MPGRRPFPRARAHACARRAPEAELPVATGTDVRLGLAGPPLVVRERRRSGTMSMNRLAGIRALPGLVVGTSEDALAAALFPGCRGRLDWERRPCASDPAPGRWWAPIRRRARALRATGCGRRRAGRVARSGE